MSGEQSDDTVQFIENWEPEIPSEDEFIWRYMDFTQLISLLENDSLWFSGLDQFKDPYEGSIPPKVEEKFAEVYEPMNEDSENMAGAILSMMGSFKYITYANCWHKNGSESAAMWELYRDVGKETAIRTTVGQLKDSIQEDEYDITFGNVRYVDFDKIRLFPIMAGVGPAFHKRDSFRHEEEFRAVLIDTSQFVTGNLDESIKNTRKKAQNGKSIRIDKKSLIESIWISPTAPDWLEDLISDVVDRYNLNAPVKPSDINRSPETVLNQVLEE